jgi:hypothetical protein
MEILYHICHKGAKRGSVAIAGVGETLQGEGEIVSPASPGEEASSHHSVTH